MSIADKLQELINSKADMKSAIAEKGVDVEGGLTTYASAIRKIQQGSGDRFAAIGYNEENAGSFLQQFSDDLEVSRRILDEWNSTGSSAVDMSKWKGNTIYFPAIDLTMKPADMSFKFEDYSKLQVVPSLDFTGRTSTNKLFYGCKSLKYIGNITGTESITDMSFMFTNCKSSTSIPQMNTSSVSNMNWLFEDCTSLTSVPQMDTSRVNSMIGMFYGCSSLTSVPQMDTSSVTDISHMFSFCSSLTSIPQMDTSRVNSMSDVFEQCTSLTSIPLLDCNSITSTIPPFGYYNYLNKLTDLGGFKDLKVSWKDGFLNRITNATVESLMNVINNLYDLTANGLSGQTLAFGTHNLEKLTDEQIAVAIAKGWTLI